MYSMQALRVGFASYVPFSHPDFHRLFSDFALQAIETDRRYGRWCYPVGGPVPPPDIPIEEQLPYIFPPFTNQQQPAPPLQRGFQQPFAPFPAQDPPANNAQQQPFGLGANGALPVPGQHEPQDSPERSRDRSRGQRRKRKRRRRRSTSSASSVSEYSDHDYSFAKRVDGLDKDLASKARDIRRLRDEYRSHTLKDAVDSFCWVGNKPPDFPGALVWDLLQYNYIDLEKINAGVIPQASEQVHKSTDKDAASKIKARPFSESGEWRNALSAAFVSISIHHLFAATYPAAHTVCRITLFIINGLRRQPSAAQSFKKYTRHVKSLEIIFTRRVSFLHTLLPSLSGSPLLAHKPPRAAGDLSPQTRS